MKKTLTILAVTVGLNAFAGTRHDSGEYSALLECDTVPVTLNWTNAVYAKSGKLSNFLRKADRDPEWESKSMSYFFKKANRELSDTDIVLVSMSDTTAESSFYFEIMPYTITKDGDLKGEILLKKTGSYNPLAVATFSSDERDENDAIAFKDQLDNIGESFGNYLTKQIKKAIKANRSTKR